MTPRLKAEAVPALMILASWLFVAHHWGRLPDQIPVHWGLSGNPDAFAPKVPGAFMIPAIGTMLTLTMMAWPAFAPRSSARETLLGVFQVQG